ncbi:MAG: class I lanthipeptide [Bacteroidetes bacterium]|nr:class I lanthipeptide [Bacteroidota bacterium]
MKKTITKLSLNKSTISNLGAYEMHQKMGGVKFTRISACCGTNTYPPTKTTCPASKVCTAICTIK